MAVAKTEAKLRKRRPAIKGIVAFSRALDCNREHLRLVILGERKSPGLLARYELLKNGGAK